MPAWLGCLTTLLATQTAPPPFPLEALKGSGYGFTDSPSAYRVQVLVPDTGAKMNLLAFKSVNSYLTLQGVSVIAIVWDSPAEPSQDLLSAAFKTVYAMGGLIYEPASAAQPRWRILFRTTARADIDAPGMKDLLFVTAVAGDKIATDLKAVEAAK